jgi:outer membrane protein TolC
MISKTSIRRSKHPIVPAVTWLLGFVVATSSLAAAPDLSLPDAVLQALASNLDLIAQRQALAAARQEIGLARSNLLPQVNVGARAQLINEARSDSLRGNNEDRSLMVAAGLSQVIYDEGSWAGFDIQKHVYQGQVQELESFRLGVIQDAAVPFLELDRSERVLAIQERNRELTRRNRETSRARIAAGWSSDREVLRWDTQLAMNDSDVRAAQVLVLQNRFELNRVRNLPVEEPVAARPATIDEYGFMYARQAIVAAVATPDGDRRMRDYLARVGVRRSPDLAAIESSIAAAERQLTANRRAFWVPSLTLGAGIDRQLNRSSIDEFTQTEWGVRGVLSFPLFVGGAKFVGLEQANEVLASLRTQKRATAQSLEQTIRSAFAAASGSFATVGFAQRQVAAASRNFSLVDASYTLGVDSILDLLDAQSQLLTAELAFANAGYDFLEDLIVSERAISFYAFLEAPGEVAALIDELERELAPQP